jgi:tetratricopeptide (TPR) repeat protein
LLVTAYAHVGSPEAVGAGEQAVAIYERIGDLVGLGNVLNNLGVNAFYRGNWDESTDYHTRAGDARRQAGHIVGAAASVNNLAEIYCDQGKLWEAEQSFREALYVFSSSEFPVGVALASANLGLTLTRMGELEEAWKHLENGRTMFEEMGAQAFIHETDVKIAEHHLLSRRWAKAKELAETALSAMEQDESTLRARTGLHRVLGYCAASAGRLDEAEAEFMLSVDLANQAAALFEQASTYQAMARTLRDHEHAGEWNKHQAEVFEQLGVIATLVIPLA